MGKWSFLVPLGVVYPTWGLATYLLGVDVAPMYQGMVQGIPRWAMALAMSAGSVIAGATSEGGASVAFPVMTLAFGFSAGTARDFSLAIQSVGMTAAAVTIWLRGIPFDRRVVRVTLLPGIVGVTTGLIWVAPIFPPAYVKMAFVSIWFSFAFSLFCLNRHRGRTTFDSVPDGLVHCVPLALAGGFGGLLTSLSGSGIDISVFAVSTLYYRVSEKIATPTSVVIMALNTCVGFLDRVLTGPTVHQDVWDLLYVCVPVVVIGAPLGSMFASRLHRRTLASFLYVTDTVQFVAAFCIVPLTAGLVGMSVGLVVIGAVGFWSMAACGARRLPPVQVSPHEVGASV
jgi:uncharacterized membrane protein YfcA